VVLLVVQFGVELSDFRLLLPWRSLQARDGFVDNLGKNWVVILFNKQVAKYK